MYRMLHDDHIAHFGEGLRNLVSALDDTCSLLFLYRVSEDFDDDIRAYEVTLQNGWLRWPG